MNTNNIKTLKEVTDEFDEFIIENLNLNTWSELPESCEGLKADSRRDFYTNIANKVIELLKPFESLHGTNKLKGLYQPQRQKLLERCVKPTQQDKYYYESIKRVQKFLNNRLDQELYMCIQDDKLIEYIQMLINTVKNLELLYIEITIRTPGSNNPFDRHLLKPNEFRTINWKKQNTPASLMWL